MRFITRIRYLAAVLAATLVALLTLGGTAHAGGPSGARFACVDNFGTDWGTINVVADTSAGKIRLRTNWNPPFPIPANSAATTLNQNGPMGPVTYAGTVNPPYSPGISPVVILGYIPKVAGTIAVGQPLYPILSSASPSITNWSLRIGLSVPAMTLYCVARTAWSPLLIYS